MQTLVVSVILQKGAPNSNTGTTNRIQSFAYRRHRVEALGLHLVWSLSSSPPQWFHSASTIKFNSRQKTQNLFVYVCIVFTKRNRCTSKITPKSARPIKQLKKFSEQRYYCWWRRKEYDRTSRSKISNILKKKINFTAFNFTFCIFFFYHPHFSIGSQTKREDSRISNFRRQRTSWPSFANDRNSQSAMATKFARRWYLDRDRYEITIKASNVEYAPSIQASTGYYG